MVSQGVKVGQDFDFVHPQYQTHPSRKTPGPPALCFRPRQSLPPAPGALAPCCLCTGVWGGLKWLLELMQTCPAQYTLFLFVFVNMCTHEPCLDVHSPNMLLVKDDLSKQGWG